MLKFIPAIALITSGAMLWLAIASIRDDLKKPRVRWRHSLDLLALSIGFVCMILTAIYALFGMALAGIACL